MSAHNHHPTFSGFSAGRSRLFSLPAAFISDLLPLIDDLAELKVTLFCYYAIQQREGKVQYLRRRDFFGSESLISAMIMCEPEAPAENTLDRALLRAIRRGSILRVEAQDGVFENGALELFFVNTPKGRTAVTQIAEGNWTPNPTSDDSRVEILPERPNAFQLYEENIGPLTPLIADALKDAQHAYAEGWLEDAIRVAVHENARHWRFVSAVLERWKKDGKHEIAGRSAEGDERDGRRFIGGEFGDFIEH
jgi:DNA replication protein